MGLLSAILDAVFGEIDQAGGRAAARLTAPLTVSETGTMSVDSTLRFGEDVDGAAVARLLINGEIITATGRTAVAPFTFTGLTRGVDGTVAIGHPTGGIILDLARNSSAVDHVRRGLFVDTAQGADLDVIGRNLGLYKCPGVDQETWRRLIKVLAYLPKNTIDAFERVLEALVPGGYDILEMLITDPYTLFVAVEVTLVTGDPEGVRGRFFLTGGHVELTTQLDEVDVFYNGAPVQLRTVNGVYMDTLSARRGARTGTNFFAGGGSFTPGANTITLGSSPGAIGTSMVIDYTGYGADDTIAYHHLAVDETVRNVNDYPPYLYDPLRAVRCVLDQIRPVGTRIDVSTRV